MNGRYITKLPVFTASAGEQVVNGRYITKLPVFTATRKATRFFRFESKSQQIFHLQTKCNIAPHHPHHPHHSVTKYSGQPKVQHATRHIQPGVNHVRAPPKGVVCNQSERAIRHLQQRGYIAVIKVWAVSKKHREKARGFWIVATATVFTSGVVSHNSLTLTKWAYRYRTSSTEYFTKDVGFN